YLATLEGTLYCFGGEGGELAWSEGTNATSSPTIWDGKCYFSRREAVRGKNASGGQPERQTEQLACRGAAAHEHTRPLAATTLAADYLDFRKRQARSTIEKNLASADEAVGFAFAS